MNVTFYDVPAAGRQARIARLVQAAWDKGKRLLVTCADSAEASELDAFLWTFDEGSFIPHEVVGPGASVTDPDARVVLVTGEYDPIGADIVLQAAPVSQGFAGGFAYVIDLVDHRTEASVEASRARYKAWASAGTKPAFIKS